MVSPQAAQPLPVERGSAMPSRKQPADIKVADNEEINDAYP